MLYTVIAQIGVTGCYHHAKLDLADMARYLGETDMSIVRNPTYTDGIQAERGIVRDVLLDSITTEYRSLCEQLGSADETTFEIAAARIAEASFLAVEIGLHDVARYGSQVLRHIEELHAVTLEDEADDEDGVF
jgi:hypothetical protein